MIRPRNTLCARIAARSSRSSPDTAPGAGETPSSRSKEGRIDYPRPGKAPAPAAPPRGRPAAGHSRHTARPGRRPPPHRHSAPARGRSTGHPLPGDDSARPIDPNPICRVVKPTSSASPSTASSASCRFGCSASGNSAPVVGKPLRIGPQMLPQPHRHLGLTLLGHQRHHPHELDERRPKRPRIRKLAHDHDQTVSDQRPDLDSSRQPAGLSD